MLLLHLCSRTRNSNFHLPPDATGATQQLQSFSQRKWVALQKVTDSFKKTQGCTLNLLLHLLKKAMHQNKRWMSIMERSSSYSIWGMISSLFQQASMTDTKRVKTSYSKQHWLVLAITPTWKKKTMKILVLPFCRGKAWGKGGEKILKSVQATAHAILVYSGSSTSVLRMGQAPTPSWRQTSHFST